MNKRMKAQAVLRIARKAAREVNGRIVEIPKRGKGSHRMFQVVDTDGAELDRFGLTDHTEDISWAVLRSVENRLAHLFGEKWMENS